MKQFENVTTQVKSSFKENAAVARAGYGTGFWTLVVGLMIAASVVFQMENTRVHPTVERIPAAELTENVK